MSSRIAGPFISGHQSPTHGSSSMRSTSRVLPSSDCNTEIASREAMTRPAGSPWSSAARSGSTWATGPTRALVGSALCRVTSLEDPSSSGTYKARPLPDVVGSSKPASRGAPAASRRSRACPTAPSWRSRRRSFSRAISQAGVPPLAAPGSIPIVTESTPMPSRSRARDSTSSRSSLARSTSADPITSADRIDIRLRLRSASAIGEATDPVCGTPGRRPERCRALSQPLAPAPGRSADFPNLRCVRPPMQGNLAATTLYTQRAKGASWPPSRRRWD